MIEFIVAAIIVALGVVALRLNDRLTRLQREFEALRGFVLETMPVPAAPPSAEADDRPGQRDVNPWPWQPAGDDADAPGDAPDDAADAGAATGRAAPSRPMGDAMPAVEARPAKRRYAWSTDADLEPDPEPAAEPDRDEPAPASQPARPDIETALGTRWAVWVGGLALALGGVFLVRYSIEAGIFGPGLRLTMAGLFGTALVAAGEAIRRSGLRMPVEGLGGAWMPGILTAAGAFTLFGTVYAAHGLYGFIGPTLAFLLLGLLGIGTILAALIHGQALAGVGLLGAFATPMLVSSQAPSPWVLFGYLAVVLVACAAIARLRGWTALMTAAVVAMGLWSLLYLIAMVDMRLAPALFANAVVLAVLALIWHGFRDAPARVDPPSVATGLFVGLAALFLLNDPDFVMAGGEIHAALLVAAMVAIAWWRPAALPLLHAAGAALVLAHLRIALSGVFAFEILGQPMTVQGPAVLPWTAVGAWMSALLAVLFLAVGVFAARRFVSGTPRRAAIWSGWAVLVPLCVLASGWIAYGDVDRDFLRAAAALALVAAFVAAGEVVARSEEPPLSGGLAAGIAFAGAAAATAFLLLMAFGPLWTTMLAGAAAALPALATRWRDYPVLGWLSVAAALFVLGRAAIDPTIVGAEFLGTLPLFNALLPGYGIPALAFGFAAWRLARTTDGRPRLAMEAAAVLFALLAAAMLVRHAMSGGIIDGAAVTLAEQAIYTLIMLGAGAILVAIDARSPSSVMRIGSLAAAVLSVALIAIRHLGTLNPLFTGEPTGRIPVFDLLLLGYLLPGAAAAGLAWFARGRRPRWYSIMLALTAAALVFAWVSLTVRRLFQGENLAVWRGLSQLETYAYSAVWLALGVGILVLGVRFASQALRIASGVLVALAVAKVFLFDMAELEGVLRAFSFIGLGAVLIGIGLFYQRLLTGAAAKRRAEPEPERPAEEAPVPAPAPPARRVTLPAREPAETGTPAVANDTAPAAAATPVEMPDAPAATEGGGPATQAEAPAVELPPAGEPVAAAETAPADETAAPATPETPDVSTPQGEPIPDERPAAPDAATPAQAVPGGEPVASAPDGEPGPVVEPTPVVERTPDGKPAPHGIDEPDGPPAGKAPRP